MTLILKVMRAALVVPMALMLGCGSTSSSTPPANTTPMAGTPPATPPPAPPPAPPSPPATPTDFPAGFWDATNIPPAKNVMIFKFLNRTNGKYTDDQVFWKVSINGAVTSNSIAAQPTFDMPANASGRIYVYLGGLNSKYYDFMEYTIGPTQFNGNTTRVDAFGVKLTMRLHCADGFEATVGENYPTFAEDRAVTFQRFIDAVPPEFQHLAQVQAPYRILSPDSAFQTGGQYANYYSAYVDQIWQANGITVPKPGPNGSGLGSYPNLSAAIFRHVGAAAGSFSPTGDLMDKNLWANSQAFYQNAPANYYADFWHQNAVNGKAYGFPYDDVGGYSSYISHQNPQYMLVAIGW